MKSKRNKSIFNRKRSARSDGSIGALSRTIENLFKLPKGAVSISGGSRRKSRKDMRVGTLRKLLGL